MKESIQKTKQLARTIQESGRNQKVGFVDNRTGQFSAVKTIQRVPLYRAGEHEDATYVPRHPADTSGNVKKRGLSTFDGVGWFPIPFQGRNKQIINSDNLAPELVTRKVGHHYAIRPSDDADWAKLLSWAQDPEHEASAIYTQKVKDARTGETGAGG